MVPEVPPKSKTRPNDGDKSSKQPNSKYNNSKNLYKCDYPLLPIYNYKTEKIKEVWQWAIPPLVTSNSNLTCIINCSYQSS